MKKSSIKKIFAVVIIVLIISIIVITLKLLPDSEPDYRFLTYKKPFTKLIEHKESTSIIKETRFYYTYETDFNDFYARASSELSELGFIPGDSLMYSISEESQPLGREYEWGYNDSGGSVYVFMIENHALTGEQKNTGKYAVGYVSVYILQSSKENRLIHNIKLLLYKLRN